MTVPLNQFDSQAKVLIFKTLLLEYNSYVNFKIPENCDKWCRQNT